MQNNEKICIKRAFKKRSREAASLTAQPLEEGYYLLPGLKLIAAPLYGCAHERRGVGGGNVIVAIEKLLLVCKDYAVPGRSTEIFLYPSLNIGKGTGRVAWGRSHDINVITFYEHLISLVHAGGGVVIAVVKGVEVDEHDGALASFLPVIDPAYYGHEIMVRHLVGETVLTVKTYGVGIVLAEQREGVDQRVLIAKQAIEDEAPLSSSFTL